MAIASWREHFQDIRISVYHCLINWLNWIDWKLIIRKKIGGFWVSLHCKNILKKFFLILAHFGRPREWQFFIHIFCDHPVHFVTICFMYFKEILYIFWLCVTLYQYYCYYICSSSSKARSGILYENNLPTLPWSQGGQIRRNFGWTLGSFF
jgi:hypothetical protein